jgi:hypothetical protein
MLTRPGPHKASQIAGMVSQFVTSVKVQGVAVGHHPTLAVWVVSGHEVNCEVDGATRRWRRD